MKKIVATAIGFGLVTILHAAAQQAEEPRPGAGGPPRGERSGQTETLTDAQKAQVKTILSAYDPSTLTAEQAKAIQNAFRQAGLRGGPIMADTIRIAGFDPEKLRSLAPPPEAKRNEARPDSQENKPAKTENDRPVSQGSEPRSPQSQYSIAQSVSDRAQLSTIAFSGLAFITGDFGASTFIPPGKVCDFFGFQYMRDIDAAQKGHNPMFLNRVAGNVFHVLNDDQKKMFTDLAAEQSPQLEALAKMRLPMIKAFCQHLGGQAGLSKAATVQHTANIFEKDMELSIRRAEVMAQVYNSLDADQKAYFAQMKFGDFNTWPALDERDKLKAGGKGQSKLFNVAYMTYASEFFSWTAGIVEADTYFCPERHGTYFGGFYMKDMPAMGKRDFDISTSVTGDSGMAFIEQVLTADQRKNILAIADLQRPALMETINVRREISVELRKLLTGGTPDKTKLTALGRRYGELDGEMSWYYATAFAAVNKTLTADQRAALMKLRNLDGYTSAPYYIYSQAMQEQPVLNGVEAFFK